MKIQKMFYDDINREINGVIKVDQAKDEVTKQEVEEYVITKELKKHFVTFFNCYADAFRKPTADVGVWISGFFGSGKSHFLKILSYILENRSIQGKTTVESFRSKFEDDPATFMLIDRCTRTPAETILFNIDIEGPMNKDKTAVLQIFTKMFYKHLGFYGEDLKVAKLEQYVEKKGKTEEFRRVFEEKRGESWLNSRSIFDFCEDEVVETLEEVLGMSEKAARNWFNGAEHANISIASLVAEMKAYVDTKPDDYRLLFMIDEVGQYVGGDTDMLLNLQSLTEKIGSECQGKIWIMCTGQEAIDEIIRTRTDEFSRIQARFKTRLALSSASSDEVIQKRILRKTDVAKTFLEDTYEAKRNEMANLFKFRDAIRDIRGFETPEEFAVNFPFVPYQFILMQKVFQEIRKHGNAGKHLSGGARSMLSGFQEAAQNVQEKDENALVPFYMFYDTVHTFLDSSIRQVIERCERAVEDGKGLENGDQNVLKLLYMIRYVDDIPAKIDNIIILMADDIRIDKINAKTSMQKALDRLVSQNYIARTGDSYSFLTDAEQDIQKEIANTTVDNSEVSRKIGDLVFGKIYTAKRFRYNNYDFNFNKTVDDIEIENQSGNMGFRILTMATPELDKSELRLTTESSKTAICLLADTPYFDYTRNALQIKKYARTKNVSQLPKGDQSIIRGKQEDAEQYEEDAELQLTEAFKRARFYVDGRQEKNISGTPKEIINQLLQKLVEVIYYDLEKVEEHAESDQDILDLLSGKKDAAVAPGFEANRQAADMIEQYIDSRHQQNQPINMADIQKRFQAVPYGWKEIDVAYVTARLILDQKVTVQYNGETIRADNKKLPDLLRKKTEIGKTKIKKREEIPVSDIRAATAFMRDFFTAMDIPSDDEGLIRFIESKFRELQEHYGTFSAKYARSPYPGKKTLNNAIRTIDTLLGATSDDIGFVKQLLEMEDELYDMQEDMEAVEGFFDSQVGIFDRALQLENEPRYDSEKLADEAAVNQALNEIRRIVVANVAQDNYNYNDIPKLNELMRTVREGHTRLLEAKKAELLDLIRECMEAIHAGNRNLREVKDIIRQTDEFYTKKKDAVNAATSITLLESYINELFERKSDAEKLIETIEKDYSPKPESADKPKEPKVPAPSKPHKKIRQQMIFSGRIIQSEADVETYIEEARNKLKEMLKEYGSIDII